LSLEKLLTPGLTIPTDMTQLEWQDGEFGGAIKLSHKPRYSTGEHIVALGHFDETNLDSTYKWVRMFKDAAYDARFIGRDYARWNTNAQMFGDACLEIGHDQAAIALPYHSRYNNKADFTIEFFVGFESVANTYMICGELYYLSASQRGRWAIWRVGTELMLTTFDSDGNQHSLTTSGLGLDAGEQYHIRCSHSAQGEVWISVDGTEVAHSYDGKVLATLDETICPFVGVGGQYRHNLQLNTFGFPPSAEAYVDEFVMSDEFLPSNYDVPTEAIKPFSTDPQTAKIGCWPGWTDLDSGYADSIWDASSLVYLNEDDFNAEEIKLRVCASNNNSPNFSGDPLTLTEFRAGSDPVGRYLHIEYTFYSDGDTKRSLSVGVINVSPPAPDTPDAPVITSITNDGTGTSFTATIDGELENLKHYLFYREIHQSDWIEYENYRTGDGDLQVVNIQPGIYEVVCISKTPAGLLSPISDPAHVFVSSTSDPVHERIMDHIVNTLESIMQVNGYKFNVAKVDRVKTPPKKVSKFPYLIVGMNNEPEDYANDAQMFLTLSITIIAWIKSHNQADDCSAIIAEIKKALAIDPTRGGLALDTAVKDKRATLDKISFPTAQPYGRTELDVEVLYYHKKGNPYEIQ
jgi:hypothetical protein